MEVRFCKHCRRPFGFVDRRLSYGQSELEPINCAYCGKTHSHAKTTGVFAPVKLTPDQERAWLAEHPS